MARNDLTVGVILTDDLLARVKAVAARETISVSAVIRRALLAYFFGPSLTDSNGHSGNALESESDDLAGVAG